MFTLKTLEINSIPSALRKAKRYRLLNEPREAESIVLDILRVNPDNQDALKMLILAHTDKFKSELNPAFTEALEVLDQLESVTSKSYYRGIIYERRAKAHLTGKELNSGKMAFEFFAKAMKEYEQVLDSEENANQDVTLRWNTCARLLNDNPTIKPTESAREVELTDAYE